MSLTTSNIKLLTLTDKSEDFSFGYPNENNDSTSDMSGKLSSSDMEMIKKLQIKKILADGNIIYRDANLKSLENNILDDCDICISNNTLFLEEKLTGKILITVEIANKYGIVSPDEYGNNIDNFVEEKTGEKKELNETNETENKSINEIQYNKNIVTSPKKEEKTYIYTPVENEIGGIIYENLCMYAKFEITHKPLNNSIYTITQNSELEDIISAGTCQINSAEGLKQFEKLSHESAFSSSRINVIISDNINMSEYNNWAGIRNFSGIFDGNGYIISNLSGIQGLFANTINSKIINVGLDNVNIKGTLSYTGGLIGFAKSTSISNCYVTGNILSNTTSSIKNIVFSDKSIYSSGTGGLVGLLDVVKSKSSECSNVYTSVNIKGKDGVGGLIGSMVVNTTSQFPLIENAYSIGSVTGNNQIGGFIGIMLYRNNISVQNHTAINNCYCGGKIIGSNDIGGFMGSFACDENTDENISIFKNCVSTDSLTGIYSNIGGFIGNLVLNFEKFNRNSLRNCFYECMYSYSEKTGPFGIITKISPLNKEQEQFAPNFIKSEGISAIQFAGSIPSINPDGSGAYFSNISGLLEKSEKLMNVEPMARSNKIIKFLSAFDNSITDNTKLWYLNDAICDYLNGNDNIDLCNKLETDLNNGTTIETIDYQTGAKLNGTITRGAGDSWKREESEKQVKGLVIVPPITIIKDAVFERMNKSGYNTGRFMVDKYFTQYNPENISDKISLANINEKLFNKSNLNVLFDAIKNCDYKYYDDTNWGNIKLWDIKISASYYEYISSKKQELPTKVIGYKEEWDLSNAEIKRAINTWLLSCNKFKIIDNNRAKSSVWLSHIFDNQKVSFVEFNPKNIENFTESDICTLDNISKDDYNRLLDIKYIDNIENTFLKVVAEPKYKNYDMKSDLNIQILKNVDLNLKNDINSIKSIISERFKNTIAQPTE